MQELAPAPATLVDARGAPYEGAYRGAIPKPSLDRAVVPALGLLARPGGPRAPLRSLRLKTWRFVGIFRDDFTVAAAIGDVSYLGVAWTYIAEGESKVECGWKSPAAVGTRVGDADGASVAVAPGRLIALTPTRSGGLTVAIDVPGMRADLDVEGDTVPLTVVSDTGGGHGYAGVTVKHAGNLARGTVSVGGRTYTLADARAMIDWTAAFFPRRSSWWWATGAGTLEDGRPVGFNLALGVHDDARGRFSENALWLDGTPSALPPVRFTQGKTPRDPWTIRSDDGAVDLVFEPRGERGEDVNLVFIVSRYRQPFGQYSGKLRDARGREVRIDGIPGVTERHEAVW
jgi:hypothetical protein